MADYIVGLTGGIGSGKSAVSEEFARLGIEVVDADVINRQVVEPGSDALKAIAARHGPDLLVDGHLDRAALRKVVFDQPEERKWLEALINPLIGRQMRNDLKAAESPYALLVNPVLIETGQDRACSRVLVVDVPEAVQVDRTMARDGNTQSEVEAIVAAQTSREVRLKRADDVIENTGTLADLKAAVNDLHRRYLTNAASARG
jgi:dephospho-CoA kinase